MHSFRKIQIISVFVSSMMIIYFVYIITFNNSFKKITNSENVEWIIIGNSHAYKILLDESKAYYLNEDGADIERRLKQVYVGLREFHNTKFYIINVTPLELYKNFDMLAYDNDSLDFSKPLDMIKFFESRLVETPLSIFNHSSHDNYFLSNGRKVSHGVHSREDGDWSREAHFEGNKPDINYYINSLNKLSKMIHLLKNDKNCLVILISMPLHEIYIRNLKNYLATYNMPDLDVLSQDINRLGADCYIDLYDYELPNRLFWNGDHLNERGGGVIKSVLNHEIKDCIIGKK